MGLHEMTPILVVDDEPEVIARLRGFLQENGLEVLTASTGEEALTLFTEKQPSLILLDIRLGSGLSGMEVLRRAKKSNPKIPIIVVTAADDRNISDMAKGLGACDYLTKPFSLEELQRVVLSRLKS